MDTVENASKKQEQQIKKFSESNLNLKNRSLLTLTGVEKVFEANQTKVQFQVAGSILSVTGQNLNIIKLDVESGEVHVDGVVDEIKFSQTQQKTNFFKKMFK